MYCVKCGTAFSWKTGIVEKGIIHNPHAHTFFQNNPDAQQNYLNALNGNNGCRNPIPTHLFMEVISYLDKSLYSTITSIHRRVSEFRQYYRNRYLAILQNNNDQNLDIRLDYINNIKDEKKIKQDLHRRDKKIYFKKQITQLILYAYDIAEIIFWNFHDAIPEKYLQKNISKNLYEEGSIEIISIAEKHLNLINQIIADTNNSLRNISDKFNYTTLLRMAFLHSQGAVRGERLKSGGDRLPRQKSSIFTAVTIFSCVSALECDIFVRWRVSLAVTKK
jgi:hypothetical protein